MRASIFCVTILRAEQDLWCSFQDVRGCFQAWVGWDDENGSGGFGGWGDFGDGGNVGGGGWEVEIHLGIDADEPFGHIWRGHCAIVSWELMVNGRVAPIVKVMEEGSLAAGGLHRDLPRI